MIDALRVLGARIDDAAGAVAADGARRRLAGGGSVAIDASSSSQFVSALLLSGPRFNQGVEVRHVGRPVPSVPHIRMTVDMLRAVGALVEHRDEHVWRVEPGPLARPA